MISANGGLPAHRYTPQVTPRWPRGSEPASLLLVVEVVLLRPVDGLSAQGYAKVHIYGGVWLWCASMAEKAFSQKLFPLPCAGNNKGMVAK